MATSCAEVRRSTDSFLTIVAIEPRPTSSSTATRSVTSETATLSGSRRRRTNHSVAAAAQPSASGTSMPTAVSLTAPASRVIRNHDKTNGAQTSPPASDASTARRMPCTRSTSGWCIRPRSQASIPRPASTARARLATTRARPTVLYRTSGREFTTSVSGPPTYEIQRATMTMTHHVRASPPIAVVGPVRPGLRCASATSASTMTVTPA